MTVIRLGEVLLGKRIAPSAGVKHLRLAKKAITGKVLAKAVLLVALGSGAPWHVAACSQRVVLFRTPRWEQNLRRMSAHVSEFVTVSETLAWPGCGDVRTPEALLTPDPMLQIQDDDLHVRVSFIVGSDGEVHSPVILDSGGAEEDQAILRAVRAWRYRPARCNGVPADSEARVRFALR
jgi:TonB family protein